MIHTVEPATFSALRERTLHALMTLAAAAGTVTIIAALSGIASLRENLWRLVPLFTAQVALVAATLLRQRLPFRVRALGLVTYNFIGGAVALSVVGLTIGPGLALMSAVMCCGLFFGARAAALAMALSLALITATGAAFSLEWLSPPPDAPLSSWRLWLRLGVIFATIGGVTSALVLYIVRHLEAALKDTHAALDRLKDEQRERAQAEHERHLAQETALRAQRLDALGRMAGGVSHDFNNALLVVQSWAEMLEEAPQDAELAQEAAQEIRGAVRHAQELTQQLQLFARQNLQEHQSCDLARLLAQQERTLRALLPADIALTLRCEVQSLLWMSEGSLQQILLNLAINARDAMPIGGRFSIDAWEEDLDAPPHGLAPGRWIRLEVSDTGVGISPEIIERVFDPFFTTKPRGKGTGLGLASVYALVQRVGGAVWIRSTPGEGTCLCFLLPRAAPAPQERQPTPGRQRALLQALVLLVDDHDQVRRATRRALEKAGLRVLEARDGLEATRLAQQLQEPLALLITDAVMPHMGARELLAWFALHQPQVPALVCSGYVDEQLLQRGIAEGEVAFLAKPYSQRALLDKVRDLLQQAHTHGDAAGRLPQ
jgi:signal transduction histidine kinase/ActR/RegA family two-component response regulator